MIDAHFIGGAWTRSNGRLTKPVFNPATGAKLTEVALGDATDVDAAVLAARAALPCWSATPVTDRTARLRALAELLEERRDTIADLICGELGMPLKQCRDLQLGMPIAILRDTAAAADNFAFEEEIGNSRVLREPVGVVGAITPWNYPIHQIAAKLAPALAAGCTIVIKPSEIVPQGVRAFAEAVADAGIPAGVVNVVFGDGPCAGEALVRHPDVNMVSFTGSTRAGARVATNAAEGFKRVALELGGKSASVVLDDADVALATRATIASAMLNCGQTCAAQTRLVVPVDQYTEAAAAAREALSKWRPGDPRDPATRIGPLVSQGQRERVRGLVNEAIAQGAEVVAGSIDEISGAGWYFEPLVLGKVKPDAPIAQQEVFGPVLCLLTHEGDLDAIRIANATPYGLSGAVWSGSNDRAMDVARAMRTGQVAINGGAFNFSAPFGGYGHSGVGRENGRYGLEEYLEYKAVQL